jgi:5'(3')-deoxyribonucleotidase
MFVRDEEKLLILVQGHECLYNLQHNDYDNNLVKDNCWEEIAGELYAQDKEISRRTQHCRRMAG